MTEQVFDSKTRDLNNSNKFLNTFMVAEDKGLGDSSILRRCNSKAKKARQSKQNKMDYKMH